MNSVSSFTYTVKKWSQSVLYRWHKSIALMTSCKASLRINDRKVVKPRYQRPHSPHRLTVRSKRDLSPSGGHFGKGTPYKTLLQIKRKWRCFYFILNTHIREHNGFILSRVYTSRALQYRDEPFAKERRVNRLFEVILQINDLQENDTVHLSCVVKLYSIPINFLSAVTYPVHINKRVPKHYGDTYPYPWNSYFLTLFYHLCSKHQIARFLQATFLTVLFVGCDVSVHQHNRQSSEQMIYLPLLA